MNKVHILWASLAALALAACNTTMEIDDTPEAFGGMKVLSVKAARGEVTKTAYADDKTFSWSVDDQVSILCNDGSVNNWETFTATDAAASSTLTATVSDDTHIGALTTGKKPALYPASDNHEYPDDSDISFYLPAERDFRASEGGHEEAAIPLFAWGNDAQEFAFANMTGAVKFSFSGLSASVTQVKFTFTSAGQKMNGLFPLSGLDAGDAASVTWATAPAGSDAEKTLTFYADVKNGGAHFYVPYPTGTLTAGSQVRLENTDGTVLYQHNSLGAISVTKNRIVVLPPIILGPTSLTFTESDEDIVNPERGFSDVGTITFAADGSYGGGVTYNENNSLVHIMFYLKGFISKDNINDTALNNIRGIIDEVRAGGKKVIIRFAYQTSTTDAVKNAVKSRVLNHIGDLEPIFTAYKDVIYVVQAGFLGTWGEWLPGYTTGFAPYTYEYDPIGSEGNTNIVSGEGGRKEVLEKLLAVVPASRQIALRIPRYKMAHIDKHIYHWSPITGWDDANEARRRLSFHNDAFRSTFNSDKEQNPTGQLPKDMGTFLSAEDRKMWMQQSAYLAIGGETATIDGIEFTQKHFNRAFSYEDPHNPGTYLSYAGADNTIQALYDYHYSYLKYNPDNDFIKRWTSDGRITDIRKALGYRLWLSEACVDIPDLSASTECTVTFTLKNSGAAPVINPRPMKLVLIQNGASTELEDFADVREVASKGQKTFTATFDLPEDIKGGAKLALWLPDDAAGLQDKPAYAIRLANNETTFEGIGYNVFYTF